MRILAFVDMHGSMSALKKIEESAAKENVDAVVCAGDVTVFGDSMKYLVSRLDKIGKPVFMLHGNHEGEMALKHICDATKNVLFLHQKVVDLKECVFIGFGGGGFSTRDEHFEEWSKRKLQGIDPRKKIVLITHAPPYGTNLSKILDGDAGNKSFTDFIKKAKPALVVCGHLHENRGMEDKIGETKIINPGPWGKTVVV